MDRPPEDPFLANESRGMAQCASYRVILTGKTAYQKIMRRYNCLLFLYPGKDLFYIPRIMTLRSEPFDVDL
jgi:hypothetical protein